MPALANSSNSSSVSNNKRTGFARWTVSERDPADSIPSRATGSFAKFETRQSDTLGRNGADDDDDEDAVRPVGPAITTLAATPSTDFVDTSLSSHAGVADLSPSQTANPLASATTTATAPARGEQEWRTTEGAAIAPRQHAGHGLRRQSNGLAANKDDNNGSPSVRPIHVTRLSSEMCQPAHWAGAYLRPVGISSSKPPQLSNKGSVLPTSNSVPTPTSEHHGVTGPRACIVFGTANEHANRAVPRLGEDEELLSVAAATDAAAAPVGGEEEDEKDSANSRAFYNPLSFTPFNGSLDMVSERVPEKADGRATARQALTQNTSVTASRLLVLPISAPVPLSNEDTLKSPFTCSSMSFHSPPIAATTSTKRRRSSGLCDAVPPNEVTVRKWGEPASVVTAVAVEPPLVPTRMAPRTRNPDDASRFALPSVLPTPLAATSTLPRGMLRRFSLPRPITKSRAPRRRRSGGAGGTGGADFSSFFLSSLAENDDKEDSDSDSSSGRRPLSTTPAASYPLQPPSTFRMPVFSSLASSVNAPTSFASRTNPQKPSELSILTPFTNTVKAPHLDSAARRAKNTSPINVSSLSSGPQSAAAPKMQSRSALSAYASLSSRSLTSGGKSLASARRHFFSALKPFTQFSTQRLSTHGALRLFAPEDNNSQRGGGEACADCTSLCATTTLANAANAPHTPTRASPATDGLIELLPLTSSLTMYAPDDHPLSSWPPPSISLHSHRTNSEMGERHRRATAEVRLHGNSTTLVSVSASAADMFSGGGEKGEDPLSLRPSQHRQPAPRPLRARPPPPLCGGASSERVESSANGTSHGPSAVGPSTVTSHTRSENPTGASDPLSPVFTVGMRQPFLSRLADRGKNGNHEECEGAVPRDALAQRLVRGARATSPTGP